MIIDQIIKKHIGDERVFDGGFALNALPHLPCYTSLLLIFSGEGVRLALLFQLKMMALILDGRKRVYGGITVYGIKDYEYGGNGTQSRH